MWRQFSPILILFKHRRKREWVRKSVFGRVRILIKIRLKIKFDIFSIVNLSKFNFDRILMSIFGHGL